jgi:hypothetical protein
MPAGGPTMAGDQQNKKKQQPVDARTAELNKARLDQALSNNPQTSFSVSGTPLEQAKAIEGLELGKIGYGQSIGQTGQDIQRIKELQKARTDQSGADPISAAIMGQKAGAVANANRSMQQAGVKGGVAAGALDQISRNRDADIAASLYGQQRQSILDERTLASNMLSGTTSLMYGSKAEGTAGGTPNPPQTSGMFGTVICTELYRQGYMDVTLYTKDAAYGRNLPANVVKGYQFLARPIVKLMQVSKLATKLISYPALAWARHIAGDEFNIVGYVAQTYGEPICGFIGKFISGEKYDLSRN